jgi:hypothetical protein
MEPDLIRAVGLQIYGYDSIMRMGTLTSNLSHSSTDRRRSTHLPPRQPSLAARALATAESSPVETNPGHQRPKL